MEFLSLSHSRSSSRNFPERRWARRNVCFLSGISFGRLKLLRSCSNFTFKPVATTPFYVRGLRNLLIHKAGKPLKASKIIASFFVCYFQILFLLQFWYACKFLMSCHASNKSTWSHENRVSKHFIISLNFPCLRACSMCSSGSSLPSQLGW